MLISDHLHVDCIDINVNSDDKKEIIEGLAKLLFKQYSELDEKEALYSLVARENLLSTGIGEGIAIPHARLDQCNDVYVAIGLMRNEVDFNSLDGKPVQIVILAFFPKDKVNLQLRMLAKVSRLMQKEELKTELMTARTAQEAYEIIKGYESKKTY